MYIFSIEDKIESRPGSRSSGSDYNGARVIPRPWACCCNLDLLKLMSKYSSSGQLTFLTSVVDHVVDDDERSLNSVRTVVQSGPKYLPRGTLRSNPRGGKVRWSNTGLRFWVSSPTIRLPASGRQILWGRGSPVQRPCVLTRVLTCQYPG